METRRDFLRLASASLGALLTGGAGQAKAQPEPSLIVQLEALCRRLAPLGWQSMMLAVTGGGLDITAPDLARELAKPVTVDRTYPGFGDFALAGTQGIEPGRPDESLLYHALAADGRVGSGGAPAGRLSDDRRDRDGGNYVYATRAAPLDALHAAANGLPVAIATFALHYRNAPDSVSGKHAQLCFSRTGITRLGDLEPFYRSGATPNQHRHVTSNALAVDRCPHCPQTAQGSRPVKDRRGVDLIAVRPEAGVIQRMNACRQPRVRG